MSSADPRELARLGRLLHACRRGLNHDLTNQLVALRGLLQLLEQEEAARLTSSGQDYVRRLLAVGQRTQGLARTLRDLTRLGGAAPPSEAVVLPDLVEEVVAALQPPPACVMALDAQRTFVARPLLKRALELALDLLAELGGQRAGGLEFCSHPDGPSIELAIRVGLLASTSQPAPSGSLPGTWHDRLDCVLLRELAVVWGGDVRWHKDPGGAAVTLTLPAPR